MFLFGDFFYTCRSGIWTLADVLHMFSTNKRHPHYSVGSEDSARDKDTRALCQWDFLPVMRFN